MLICGFCQRARLKATEQTHHRRAVCGVTTRFGGGRRYLYVAASSKIYQRTHWSRVIVFSCVCLHLNHVGFNGKCLVDPVPVHVILLFVICLLVSICITVCIPKSIINIRNAYKIVSLRYILHAGCRSSSSSSVATINDQNSTMSRCKWPFCCKVDAPTTKKNCLRPVMPPRCNSAVASSGFNTSGVQAWLSRTSSSKDPLHKWMYTCFY